MKFTISLPPRHENEVLDEQLRLATQSDGEVGEVAKTLAQLDNGAFLRQKLMLSSGHVL